MTLPAVIRVNVSIPFPALAQGAAFITLVKANGIWTITPNYQLLAQATGVTATQIIAVYDTGTGVWNYVNALGFGGGGSSYRTVTTTGLVTVLPSDTTILLQKGSSGASSIQLPQSAVRNGLPVTVKDMTYDAFTNHITWLPAAGEMLDGFSAAASITNGVALIDVDGGKKTFYPLTSGGWYL